MNSTYPAVLDPSKVGTYPALARSGGGFVWDAVLEYRVWSRAQEGTGNGSAYYHAFDSVEEAEKYSLANAGTEKPLALVLQREYIAEPEAGRYVHVREERITEWQLAFLARPKRDEFTIPDFFAEDAPANRLAILRGLAPRMSRTGTNR